MPPPSIAMRGFYLNHLSVGLANAAKPEEAACDLAAVSYSVRPARDEAFARLVEAHSRLMFRVALSLLRNAQDAEDAVQEAFLKLYRGDAWRRIEDEKAFLARTVWRVALDRLPKRREQSLELAAEPATREADSPEADAVRGAKKAMLRRMIDALPETLRRVLVLSAIEELNSREIAEVLGVPEGTVRTRLMRARDELKRRFEASTGSAK